MKKIDLLKLLENMEDEAEVLDILKDHEEIKSLAKDFDVNSITLEDFKTMLANNETIKGYHQSTLDSAVSKGVESFKTNKMPSYLEKAIKDKENEGKTPEQIRLLELEKKLETMEKEKTKAELMAKYTKTLNEKKLPSELVNFIIADNEEVINENIGKFENMFKSTVDSLVQEKLKGGEYVPPKGETTTLKNPFSKEYFNLTEQARILKENPALASTLKASANK